MKKILILFCILFVGISYSNGFVTPKQLTTKEKVTTNVYICTGNYSKRYHFKKNCRGLNNCKAEIKQVTLDEAKKLKRTICGWED